MENCYLHFIKMASFNKTTKIETIMILFSSGSEGTPKGIELNGDNILGMQDKLQI